MSGIAGIFHPILPKPVDPSRVQAMADAMDRGGGGASVWTAPGVGLWGAAASDTVAAAADGAADLPQLIASWQERGPDCLSRSDENFAVALYDRTSDSLLLARDRFGVKPLHYARLPDGALVFASELKGLLAHPLIRRDLSPQAVDDYLAFGFVPDDASLVAGVCKLPAGHYLLVTRGKQVPEPVRWWDFDFTTPSKLSAKVLEEELVHHLRTSVRARMPGGVFVGQDVESAGLVALMAESSRKALHSCSPGEAGPLEQRFLTRHHVAALDHVVPPSDEPVADAAAIAAWPLAVTLSQHMNAALSGVGAADLFAGRRRHALFAAEQRARSLLPKGTGKALHLPLLSRSAGEVYAEAVAVTPAAFRQRLYLASFRSALQGHRPEGRYVRALAEAPAADPLSRAQYADLKIALPAALLGPLDAAGAATKLQVRTPFLDHRVAAFAAALPPGKRLRATSGQWLLKRALRRFLPPEILKAKRAPVEPPFGAWLRGQLAGEAAALSRASALAELGWFDEAILARLAADHASGKADHGRLLWQLLLLDRALQRLFGLGTSPGYSAAAK